MTPASYAASPVEIQAIQFFPIVYALTEGRVTISLTTTALTDAKSESVSFSSALTSTNRKDVFVTLNQKYFGGSKI